LQMADWAFIFSELIEFITPAPVRTTQWYDEFPDTEFRICPIKIGDTLRLNEASLIDHLCPQNDDQIAQVDLVYQFQDDPVWTAPQGVALKVDAVKTMTIAHTVHQPGPLQIYAIQGHIAWE